MSEFLGLLIQGDVAGLRRAWRKAAPQMPQPQNDAEAEAVMHHARTVSKFVPFQKQAYSHAWLVERGLPSGLPDHLKPKAERLYPRTVEAVGIGFIFRNPINRHVQTAMENAVGEIYAENPSPDPAKVKALMLERRQQTLKKLLG